MANFFATIFAIVMVISFGMMIYYFVKKKIKFALISLAISFAAFFVVGFTAPDDGHKSSDSNKTEQTSSSKKTSAPKKKDRLVTDKEITVLMQSYCEFAIQDNERLKRVYVDPDSLQIYPIGSDKKTWSIGGNVTQPNDNKVYVFGLKLRFDKDILDGNTDLDDLKYGSEVEYVR
jgi:hypothetical protein